MPEKSPLPVTERTRHRRLREQGSTDRADLAAILAAGVICHLGAAGYRVRDRDPRGRAGAGQVGVRARGQLPQRDDLRHAPAGDRPGREAGRAARSGRAHRARPVGLRPPSEQEGTGQDLAARAGLGRGVGEDSPRPARRRRLARRGPAGLGRRAAADRRLAGPGARPGAPARDSPASAHRRPGPPPAGMTTAPVQPPLSASGRYIVDAHGRRVRLAGVNWYGAHEDDGVAPGLDRADRHTLARRIAMHGFNSVRLPFSLWMTEQAAPVPDEYLAANPDLSGATPMQVYDACVEALTGAGLIVIPNCHTLDAGWCCSESDESGLWFNNRWPAGKFLAAWRDMAARYASNPLVAGMDIMNEPRRSRVGGRVLTPTWGTGSATDIAAMYTAVGNLIHEVSPEVLIICEGLGFAADLAGVAGHPVRLERPGKLVYSLHDYSWFHPAGQPRAGYSDQMHRVGGYIL